MTSLSQTLFEALTTPVTDLGQPRFSVAPLPDHPDCFVGKDAEGKACVLVNVAAPTQRNPAPIRLESLEVLFEVPSLIHVGGRDAQGTFTIIRCRTAEPDVTSYFLSVCETILRLLEPSPGQTAIANAVNRLAFIFRKLQQAPVRSLNGLFGELFLIHQSRNPPFALAAWRMEHTSRFDFSAGDVRLDVKTAAGRVRAHNFSFDQCNPPAATVAIVASLFVERASGGISLRQIMREIEERCASSPDLLIRLHDVVAETLGTSLPEALAARFDRRLAESTLQFFDLRDIPAIRINPPAGVTDIHFRSDLSGVTAADADSLLRRDVAIGDFLPT